MKVQNPEEYDSGIEEIKIMKKISNKELYINSIIESFIETRLIGEEKMKFVCSIYNICCGNLDGLARKGKYRDGYQIPIVKEIIKQICLGLQSIHTKLKGFHGDIKPDNILLCGINNRDKQYIKLYEKANFPSLYTTVKNEYMKGKNKSKLSQEDKLKIRRKIHKTIIESMPKIEESPYEINEEYIAKPSIKIIDFGFFCHMDEKFNKSFGTRYYQSPENILHGNCTEKVDVWSLGCVLYELVTGKILFNPESDKKGSTDFHHLEMIINLCGEFNPSYLHTMKHSGKFFNKKGKLDAMEYNLDFNIKNKLNEAHINDIVLLDLLTQMLTIEQNKRISVQDILKHKFVKAITLGD
jgi:serine/threonine-protein kinase SRPK3